SVLENKNIQLEWKTRWRFAEEIICGMSYLHSQDIIYRDLKSANVLLTKHLEIKLCDFGLAKTKKNIIGSSKYLSTGSSMKGTIAWMAPELFVEEPNPGKKSDIYSYAMTLWEIASRCSRPFKDHPYPEMIGVLVLMKDMR